jgi:excisionase family DNA binding protein
MNITIEIDDDEIRRVLAPIFENRISSASPTHATQLFTVRDVADRLGLSRSKTYELINNGQIHSLAIGRSKRVTATALHEFIAKPTEVQPPAEDVLLPRSFRNLPASPPPRPGQVKWQVIDKPQLPSPIDLSPKQLQPGSSRHRMTGEEFESMCGRLREKGWPEDVVDEIRADHTAGVEQIHMLTVRETARYLGISTGSLDKLIKAGKLRLFTIAPTYCDERPSKRIPAKDVLALTQGS